MSMHRRVLLAACAMSTFTRLARAQPAPPPSRIRGTIASVADQVLTVTSNAGEAVSVAVRPDTVVTVIAPASITDIKPGSYIGTAALPQPDGSLTALEIQVFPERMRGVGEGDRPYDLRPQSTMTNGTVGDVVGQSGRTLTLSYQGGQKKVLVPATAPIITYEPGNPSLLIPGAHVIVTASKAASGSLSADRVAVGKYGLTPPM